MKLLEIENLKKSFEDLDVLHDISLGVEEGEVVAIIGPSGSGKSTLLRCCTGLEQADSGTIHYEGSYGLVFQNFNLFPHYSVLKNIMDAPVSVQKQSKKEAEKEGQKDDLTVNDTLKSADEHYTSNENIEDVKPETSLDEDIRIVDNAKTDKTESVSEDMPETVEDCEDTDSDLLVLNDNSDESAIDEQSDDTNLSIRAQKTPSDEVTIFLVT